MQAQSNILAFPVNVKLDQAKADELAIIKAGFNDLVRNPQQKNPSSPGGLGAAVGAYAMPIFYLPCGTVLHTAGQYIEPLRAKRKHTVNAVEFRCDALGLAVYVAGTVQIGEDNTDRRGVRVVVYDFDKTEATLTKYVGNPGGLHTLLHKILRDTYNRLAKDYNLAGLVLPHLVLRSASDKLPDIQLVKR